MAGIADWLAAELGHLGVDVRFDTWAEAITVLAEAPDIVIDATGGVPKTGGSPAVRSRASSWEALSTRPRRARSVLIQDEVGGHQAVSLADFLARRGCAVEICTRDRLVGRELGGSSYPVYLGNLARAGVCPDPGHRCWRLWTGEQPAERASGP
jgi:dimethylglycine catabolism A